MTRFSMRIEGGDRLRAWFAAFGTESRERMEQAVEATGIDLRSNVVRAIQRGPATGRTYQLYDPRRTHQASAPGEAPASDQGGLARSVVYGRSTPLSATVGSDLAYAAALEFGTRTIAARPAWLPAVEALRETFMRRMSDAIRGAAE